MSNPVTSPGQQVHLPVLLEQHNGDPQLALVALVSRYNDLVQQHALMQAERDAAEQAAQRSSVENQALWRSLKTASPRPTATRQNSEGQGTRDGTSRSQGFGATLDHNRPATGAALPLRRGPSSDASSTRLEPLGTSSLHSARGNHDDSFASLATSSSASSLRRTSATPPPNLSSRQSSTTPNQASLRKASSLDLNRGHHLTPATPAQSAGSADEYPRTPPHHVYPSPEPKERVSSPRLPGSTSMPSISSASDRAVDRRFLPAIVPVSPLYAQHLNGPPESGSSSPRDNSIPYAPSPTALEHQLLPPPSFDSHRRDRTPSNTSASSIGSPHNSPALESSNTRSPASSHTASSQFPSPTYALPYEVSESSYRLPSSSSQLDHKPDSPSPSTTQDTSVPQGHSDGSLLVPSERYQLSAASSSTPSTFPRSPLSPALFPFARVRVGSSSIKINERGKEIVTFLIDVIVTIPIESDPARQGGTTSWKVEKYYSDVLSLDASVKSKTTRQEVKSIGVLPDKSLFKDHAPHKSDQRKAVLERYLQTLLALPLRDQSAVCTFFNSNTVQEAGPVLPGVMSGWLVKRGRQFGGWQTRYYVLTPGSSLAYYDTPDGTKLGEIPLANAAIGRQSSKAADAGDDAYLHAFLIRTLNDKEQDADHILCAENDEARDAWVQALTTLQPVTRGTPTSSRSHQGGSVSFERDRTQSAGGSFSNASTPSVVADERRPSQQPHPLAPRRQSGGAATANTTHDPRNLSARPPPGADISPSASMPANLDGAARGTFTESQQRSNSAQGHHGERQLKPPPPPDRRRPSAQVERVERPASPEKRFEASNSTKFVTSNVSGPMNAVPLPSGYEFKKSDRSKKTKSSFWSFGARGSVSSDKVAIQAPMAPARPVFGVPLKEAVAISRIRPGLELPAIVYRCVEYLEAKNAECEEGIFRLSGSANVIRILKDRFNAEGDYNLLTSNEYIDPHAVAGLLKTFLRELPVHVLTRELHPEFIQVIDLRNRRDRVNALGRLVARLPIEEYTLFRFFFAHLCVIAQNAEVSKMNLRNLGIVFSPTLAIPAPLFSLLLAEFDLVFAVEKDTGVSQPIMVDDANEHVLETSSSAQGPALKRNRNSTIYEKSGAQVLMESDSTRDLLRAQVEEESDDDNDVSPEHYTSDNVQVDPSFLAFPLNGSTGGSVHSSPRTPTLAAPPKSPGLPQSPRPGATF